jgi:hypothetical protein
MIVYYIHGRTMVNYEYWIHRLILDISIGNCNNVGDCSIYLGYYDLLSDIVGYDSPNIGFNLIEY